MSRLILLTFILYVYKRIACGCSEQNDNCFDYRHGIIEQDKQFNAAVKHTLGLMNGGASYDNLACRELLFRSAKMIRHLNVSQTVKEK